MNLALGMHRVGEGRDGGEGEREILTCGTRQILPYLYRSSSKLIVKALVHVSA